MLPMARRSTNFPRSVVPERSASPGGVDAFQQVAILLVGAAQPEAHQRKQHRRGQLEIAHRPGLCSREFPRHAHVPAQHFGDAFAAVIAQHEPQLQRAEAASQRHAVFGEIHGSAHFRCVCR